MIISAKVKKFFLPITLGIGLLIIAAGTIFFSRNQKPTPPSLPTSHEYFLGGGCPHCAEVEKFLESWDGKDKIQIDKKEAWKNAGNSKLLLQRAKYCNIPSNEVGVPLLFTPRGKCIIGDEPIIEYLQGLAL